MRGIDEIGELHKCDAVVSGYVGSSEQVDAIIVALAQVKVRNPKAIYLCDPVMGHPEKGCIVADGVRDALVNVAMAHADIIAPNLLELRELSGLPVENFEQAIAATKSILAKGPRRVLVKHLSKAGLNPTQFEMLLATEEGIWL